MSKGQFDKAVEIVQSLPTDGPVQPSTDDKLFFYKYYKQATIGDNTTSKPGLLDFTGKAKWEAWNTVKGTEQSVCYKQYVDKLIELLKKAGDADSLKRVEELEALAGKE
ncbi:hypothetical protein AMATHDRAFT_138882 [Amanita thiersii Skay4041]|uniref:ACB domain-containing protein n=1 Tax=Amanita thiersii Skay4041 TaxID=703135 RepID=A0A2A9NYC8_9AGAR|nr:hypothetical protein AMATHDRAFT_138882 [Amanita thiersii Skay4041]